MCREIRLIQNFNDFDRLVKKSDKPVLVEFSASWCGASHINAPVLRELSQTFSDTVSFFQINIEENRHIADEYGIHQVPTLLFFHEGEPADHVSGPVPRELLIRKIMTLVKRRSQASVPWDVETAGSKQFSHILVPVDFNGLSQAAMEHAVYTAQETKAKITLLHVNILYQENRNSEQELSRLETAACELQNKISINEKAACPGPVQIRSIMARGFNAGDVILEHINEHKFDLIVMGTHGRTGLNKRIFGSTAERVLRFSTVPVMTLHTPFLQKTVKDILVPLDFSEASGAALTWGRSLSRMYNARLHIMHVLNMDIHPEYSPVSREPLLNSNPGLKGQLMNNLLKFAGMNEKQAVFSVQEGSPHRAIVQYSHEQGIDLIIMAVRGRNTYEHFLIGSTTERVVKTTHCPVLTVGRNAGV